MEGFLLQKYTVLYLRIGNKERNKERKREVREKEREGRERKKKGESKKVPTRRTSPSVHPLWQPSWH